MGEAEFKANGMAAAVMDAVSDMGSASGSVMRLLTPGGRYQVRWVKAAAPRPWANWRSLPNFWKSADCSIAG